VRNFGEHTWGLSMSAITAAPVALVGALGAAFTVGRPTQSVGLRAHQGVDDRSASTAGQSISWAAVIALISLLE
jgi:hypothetical protein